MWHVPSTDSRHTNVGQQLCEMYNGMNIWFQRTRWRRNENWSQNVGRTKRIVGNKWDKQIAINPYQRLWFINLYNLQFKISNLAQSNVTNRCNQMGDSAQHTHQLHNKVMTAFDWFVHYIKLKSKRHSIQSMLLGY